MNNKKVKQMMFSVGALDVSKMLGIYTTNSLQSLMSGSGVSYNDSGMTKTVKAMKGVHKNAIKRGWLRKEEIFQ